MPSGQGSVPGLWSLSCSKRRVGSSVTCIANTVDWAFAARLAGQGWGRKPTRARMGARGLPQSSGYQAHNRNVAAALALQVEFAVRRCACGAQVACLCTSRTRRPWRLFQAVPGGHNSLDLQDVDLQKVRNIASPDFSALLSASPNQHSLSWRSGKSRGCTESPSANQFSNSSCCLAVYNNILVQVANMAERAHKVTNME